ncbi:hypothetical protein BGZ94_009570, partial [Podila epigama]
SSPYFMSLGDRSVGWLPAVPAVIAGGLWALSTARPSSSLLTLSPFSILLAALTSFLAYLILSFHIRYNHHKTRSRFLSAASIGLLIHDAPHIKRQQPSCSSTPSPSSSSSSSSQTVQFTHSKELPEQHQQMKPQEHLQDKADRKEAGPLKATRIPATLDVNPFPSSSTSNTSPLQVLDSQQSPSSDRREWDHVVIGEGQESIQAAVPLAQQHPTRSILVLLESDVQSSTASLAQRLWSNEVLRTVHTFPHHGLSNQHDSMMDMKGKHISLPPNLSIGANLRATRLLINRSVPSSEQPKDEVRRIPLKRFSSMGGQRSTLNGNTLPPPPRILGVEYIDHENKTYHLYSKNGIVFTSRKHHLVQALDRLGISNSGLCRQGAKTDSGSSSDDPSNWPRMVFSIKLQYSRQRKLSTPMSRVASRMMDSYRHVLQSCVNTLDRSQSTPSTGKTTGHSSKEDLPLEPVILFRSKRTHHKGRVQPWTLDGDDGDKVFDLEISASTQSLDRDHPAQLSVKVVTEPMQDTFGNLEEIRKGEAVLMEGLDLAREMARRAGWTCLDEDDCQMIEWVRDQMVIQWSTKGNDPKWSINKMSSEVQGLELHSWIIDMRESSHKTKTPTLSPYASRTHSFSGPRRDAAGGGGGGGGHHRDSTLERLQGAAGILDANKSASKGLLPSVTAVVEDGAKGTRVHRKSVDRGGALHGNGSVASKRSPLIGTITSDSEINSTLPPQRPGLVTSFGGFSSLSESRSHTLALAKQTEDHLGLALSIPSPLGSLPSPAVSPSPKGPKESNLVSKESDLVSKESNLVSKESNLVSKESNLVSKESHLASNENSPSQKTAAMFSEGITAADILGSGASTPSRPEPKKLSRFSIKSYQMERNNTSTDWGLGDHLNLGSNATNVSKPNSPPTTSLSRFSAYSSLGSPTTSSKARMEKEPEIDFLQEVSPRIGTTQGGFADSTSSCKGVLSFGLEPPAELVPDFLGGSLSLPKYTSGGTLERPQSSQSLGANGTRTVHFADSEARPREEMLLRTESDPGTKRVHGFSVQDGLKEGSGSTRRPSLESSDSNSSTGSGPNNSKSKNHTRRSWGQGIGGSDILGIQGLV